jgi:hypothetical protein
MAKRNMFVGLDVHKESIDVSLAEGGRRAASSSCTRRGRVGSGFTGI